MVNTEASEANASSTDRAKTGPDRTGPGPVAVGVRSPDVTASTTYYSRLGAEEVMVIIGVGLIVILAVLIVLAISRDR